MSDNIYRSRIITVLVLILIFLLYLQLFTLESIKRAMMEDMSVSTYNLDLSAKIGFITSSLNPFDWIAMLGIAAVAVWLILSEIRSGKISKELGLITSSEKNTLIVLGIISVIAARFYIAPGSLSLGDSSLHAYRAWGAAKSLSSGKMPFWSFYNYCGYPFLQFYGPFFYIIAAVTDFIVGDIQWSVKIWLFLFHAGSVLPVYFWARTIGAKREGALLAGTAYVMTFHHTHTVLWTGALQMSAVFFFFPILLLGVEKMLTARSKIWPVTTSLVVALLILSHQGYAVYALQLVFVYTMLRWALPGANRTGPRQVLTSLLSLGAGVLICSDFLWTILFQKSGVYYPSELPIIRPALPTLEFLRKIIIWRNMWSGWTSSYMGISFLAFAAIGAYLSWKRARTSSFNEISRAATLTGALALICAASGGRLSNLALPFLAVLVAGTVEITRSHSAAKLVTILLALLLIDLLPTTVQSPYRSHTRFVSEGMEKVSDVISPHRAIYGYTSSTGTHFFNWADGRLTDIIIPTGFFPQGAPRSFNSLTAMIDGLNQADKALSEEMKDFLYMWDVAVLLTYTRDAFVSPDIPGFRNVKDPVPMALLKNRSPLIFSESIGVAPNDSITTLQERELLQGFEEDDPPRRAYLEKMCEWTKRMRIERDLNRSGVIFISNEYSKREDSPKDSHKASENNILTWIEQENSNSPENGYSLAHSSSEKSVEVIDYKVEMYKASIRYRCEKNGFLRLSFSWYPSLKVLVDGVEMIPARSLFGAIVIPAQAGEHTIDLIPVKPLSIYAVILTAFGIFVMIVSVLVNKKRVSTNN